MSSPSPAPVGEFHGTLVIEGGIETGDNRLFDAGALYWENLPLPLRWAPEDFGSHDGARHVGWITQVARSGPNQVDGSGTVFDQAFMDYLNTAGQVGVSIDPDMVEFSIDLPPEPALPDPSTGGLLAVPEETMIMHKARIRAATAVDIPAFIDAVIKPGPPEAAVKGKNSPMPPARTRATTLAAQAPASVPAPAPDAGTPAVDAGAAPTHAGLAVYALDTYRVLMLQRATDPTDPASGKWEFPGGSIDPTDASPLDGAKREFAEETGLPVPPGDPADTWTSPDGIYQCFILAVPTEATTFSELNPDEAAAETPNPDKTMHREVTAWFLIDDLEGGWSGLRDEVAAGTPWDKFDALSDEPETSEEAPAPAVVAALVAAGVEVGSEAYEAGLAAAAPPAPVCAVGDNVIVPDPAGGDPIEAVVKTVPADPTQNITVTTSAGDSIEVAPADIQVVPSGSTDTPAAPAEPLFALVASAGAPAAPPADWFEPFDLGGPTAMTVTPEGRVYGHLAPWTGCHGDFTGQCVKPPSDPDAEFFHLGTVLTAEGSEIPVGRLTVGGGHASTNLGLRAALEHYDSTSSCAAVVRAYEDEDGIALFGALVPDATPAQVAALRRSPLSADWRKVGGKYRLAGAHAVNTPGFAITRGGLVASTIAGGPDSFVYTGRVQTERHDDPVDLNAARDRIARSVGLDTQSRRAALAARVQGV